jgi:hypothetical protein
VSLDAGEVLGSMERGRGEGQPGAGKWVLKEAEFFMLQYSNSK